MRYARVRQIVLWLGIFWGLIYLAFIVLNILEDVDRDPTLRDLTALWLVIGVLGGCSWQVVRFVRAFRGGYSDAEREDRRKRGCCLKCGYNLRGNTSHVCPECGSPIAK